MSDEEVFELIRDDETSEDSAPSAVEADVAARVSPGKWKLIGLVPGVDLHVRDDASPEALALVERILRLTKP
jgi:hypothetical protein